MLQEFPQAIVYFDTLRLVRSVKKAKDVATDKETDRFMVLHGNLGPREEEYRVTLTCYTSPLYVLLERQR